MAFKINQDRIRKSRDKAYPSQISAERPLGVTRIRCDAADDVTDETGLRGGEAAEHNESAVDRFNRELRSGQGTGRPFNEDE
jgi:hypothetical protein